MKAVDIQSQIDIDEGNVLTAYADPLTKAEPWTIGRGHTGRDVHKDTVWTEQQSVEARDKDIAIALKGCMDHWSWFPELNAPRQAVLIGMAYQMGTPHVLCFHKALAAIEAQDWDKAEAELLDSAWAHQTPARAKLRAKQMRTGEWQ